MRPSRPIETRRDGHSGGACAPLPLQRRPRLRPVALLLLLSLVSLVIPSSTFAAALPPPVLKLGAVLPLSGPLAGVGYRAWLLLNQSIADLQSAPSSSPLPSGTELQLLVADSQSTVGGATRATLQLATQGVVGLIAGVEGGQNQNLTSLPWALRHLALSEAQYAASIGPQGASSMGVGVGSTHLRAVVEAAAALRPPLPVLGTSHLACVMSASSSAASSSASTSGAPNLLPLCASPRSIASAIAASLSALGWTQLLVVSMDSAVDGAGFNERYHTRSYVQAPHATHGGADATLGADGGGWSVPGSGFDSSLGAELEREAYGDDATSASPTHLPDWPYRSHPLHSVAHYRLPTARSMLPAAARSVIAQIKASQRRVVLVLLQGVALTELLQAAFEADVLGAPFVWLGAGQDSVSGGAGSEGTIVGTGEAAHISRGAGLCSQTQAELMEAFRIDTLSRRVAAGESLPDWATGGTASITQSVVDNPISSYSTTSPLSGVLCFVPGVPAPVAGSAASAADTAAAAAWVNLRYKLSAGGTRLPASVVPDANDGAVYDAPLLYAHALATLLRSHDNDEAALRDPQLSDTLRQLRGVRGLAGEYSFFSATSGSGVSPYATASLPSRAGTRVSRVDLVNFEQLSSGSGVTFVPRGSFDEHDLSLNFTAAIRWAGGATTVPVDYTARWADGQKMAKSHDGVTVVLALALLAVANFDTACHVYHSKKYDVSDPVRRSKHYYSLVRAAAPYALITITGNVYLNQMMMTLESVHDEGLGTAGLDLTYSTGVFIGIGVLATWLIVFLALAVAGSQNGSAVATASNKHIARYEVAGKTGVAGGGGGSGVNFLSSESGGDGLSSNASHGGTGNSVHNVAGGRIRATAYGGSSAKHGHSLKRLLNGQVVRPLHKTVPLWSRALEELYITGVLCFTSWRMMLSGLLLAASWAFVVESMYAAMHAPLSLALRFDAGGAIGAAVLAWVVQSYGVTILFREARVVKQVWGLVFLTGANVALWYVWDAACSYHYVQTYVTLLGDEMPTPLLVQANPSALEGGSGVLTTDDISLALFVLVAVAILNSLAQIIDILKLSRGTLDQILVEGKEELARLEHELGLAREATRAQGKYQEHLRRILELINLTRPLHRNHALAFALADPQSAAVGATGARGKGTIVPPCFDQQERGGAGGGGGGGGGGGASAGIASNSPHFGSHTGVGGAGTTLHRRDHGSGGGGSGSHVLGHGQTMVLPGSRQPSEGLKFPTPADHHITHAHVHSSIGEVATAGGAVGGAAGTAGGPVNPYEGLDFSFLARAKSESAGLKLLQELSERLFLASGPVHHRAVADIALLHVLNHPVTVELFKDTLTRPQSLWSLTMWMDIQRFKVLGIPEARRTIADGMWHTFLAAGAPHYITAVQASTRDALGKAINAAVAGGGSVRHLLFDTLESELLYQLQKEMTNFTGTAAFKISALVLGHSAYQPDQRVGTLVVRRAADTHHQHNSTGDGITTQGGTHAGAGQGGGAGSRAGTATAAAMNAAGALMSPLHRTEGSSLNGGGIGGGGLQGAERSEVGSELAHTRKMSKPATSTGTGTGTGVSPAPSPSPALPHAHPETSPTDSPAGASGMATHSGTPLASPSGWPVRAHHQQRSSGDDVQMVGLARTPDNEHLYDAPATTP